MLIEWDAPIAMDDGVVLRADIFRPSTDGKYPVILAYGPYAKGLNFAEGYADPWNIMLKSHPEVAANSSNRYQAWEVVDPERWVPDGFVQARGRCHDDAMQSGFFVRNVAGGEFGAGAAVPRKTDPDDHSAGGG